VDDALARSTDKTAKWLKRNANVLQWILVGGIAAWIGYQIYDWRADKGHGQASSALMQGVSASLAKLQTAEAEEAPAGIPASTEPVYKTTEERAQAARAAFEQTIAARPNDGTAVFAQLGLASQALDEAKFADARGIYEQVKGTSLASKNDEVKGRALEGIALSYEGEGNSDAALKAYQELENTEIGGFKETAMLARARLLFAKGSLDEARDLVTKLKERLTKDKDQEEGRSFYLQPAVTALAQAIDPNLAKPTLSTSGGNPEDLAKLQKAIEEMAKKGNAPDAPSAPADAPSEPAKTP
jgi:tetratricopeptide (TPR) repeat protein